MRKLIALELKRNRLRPYHIATLICGLTMLGFQYLMYFFLEMPDREIADYLHMARRTVNTHRIKAFQALKNRMGCDGNG